MKNSFLLVNGLTWFSICACIAGLRLPKENIFQSKTFYEAEPSITETEVLHRVNREAGVNIVTLKDGMRYRGVGEYCNPTTRCSAELECKNSVCKACAKGYRSWGNVCFEDGKLGGLCNILTRCTDIGTGCNVSSGRCVPCSEGYSIEMGFCIRKGCGGAMITDRGQIQWPQNTSVTTDCEYIVAVSTDAVQLSFTRPSRHSSVNCSYGYIEIKDINTNDPLTLYSLCDPDLPALITLNTSVFYAHFITLTPANMTGYGILYGAVKSENCGNHMYAMHGTFTSPNYPNAYDNGLDCIWTIHAFGNETIAIAFETFDLSSSYLDYFSVHNSTNTSDAASLIIKLEGKTIPDLIVTRSSVAVFRLKTYGGYSTYIGFYARYFKVRKSPGVFLEDCGGIFTDDSGIVESPNFPNAYPSDSDCEYLIASSLGKIDLEFSSFELQGSSSCDKDVLEVNDGKRTNSIQRLCGSTKPKRIASETNFLHLGFTSNAIEEYMGFRAVYSANYTGACGGNLYAPNGLISSPGYPSPILNAFECKWIIYGDPNETIVLQFEDIDIYAGAGFIYVYGNPNELSFKDRITSFSARSTPHVVVSTTGTMVVILTMPITTGHRGFLAHFYKWHDEIGCGGLYVENHGLLVSPNWPANYNPGVQCEYLIVPSIGKILLHFVELNVEESFNCSKDFVEIREDLASSYKPRRLCGSNASTDVSSTTNMLSLRFSSDNLTEANGFKAAFKSSLFMFTCFYEYFLKSGTIHSPNYPANYQNDKTCVWTIYGDPNDVIILQFDEFRTDRGDRLDIYDVVNAGHTKDLKYTRRHRIGSFYGDRMPRVVRSSTGIMELVFNTDGYEHYKGFHGFRAQYYVKGHTGCGGILDSNSGTIESPNYQNEYPANTNCEYLIIPESGTIDLTLSSFDIELSRNCDKDYLEIKEGLNETSRSWKLCGTEHPDKITSTTNLLLLIFKSDKDVQRTGFKANYKTIPPADCGGHYYSETGGFTSPEYHGSTYPNNFDCTWYIHGQPNEVIILEFPYISLEYRQDVVRVYDGNQAAADKLLGEIAGSRYPTVFRSTSGNMTVKFTCKGRTSRFGFKAIYTRWSPPTECGGVYFKEKGVINTGNRSYIYASSNDFCEYLIIPPFGGISLKPLVSTFPISQDCNSGALEVRTSLSEPAQIYCGQNISKTISTRSNLMLLKITSGKSTHLPYFRGEFESDKWGGCGNTFYDDANSITFPPTEQSYLSTVCMWIIYGEDNQTILLRFDAFNMTGGRGFVNVFDTTGIEDSPRLIANFTGGDIPGAITTNSRVMVIILDTSDDPVSPTFTAKFYKYRQSNDCGGLLTAENGVIKSPNWPQKYPPNTDCSYLILVKAGVIELTFKDFDVEPSIYRCIKDRLKVQYGGNSGHNKGYCNSSPPARRITSETNALLLSFTSDNQSEFSGFRANYMTKHSNYCGGALYSPEGTIRTPNYPRTYPDSLDCSWIIHGHENDTIVLRFKEFHIESYTDFVSVYNSIHTNNNENLIGQYNSYLGFPQKVTSTSGVMAIRYKTEGREVLGGFSATYSIKWNDDAATVKNITGVSRGTIASPQHSNSYPPNSRYIWHITMPEGKHVQISFTNFDLGQDEISFVALYSSLGTNIADRLKNFNNTQHPSYEIISPSNVLTVEFFTSGIRSNGRGFHATFSEINSSMVPCNHGYSTFPNRFATPFYPNCYPGNVQCRFTVIPGSRRFVYLQFDDIDLNNGCADYIALYNQSDSDAEPFKIYCNMLSLPQTIVSEQYIVVRFFGSANTKQHRGFGAGFFTTDDPIESTCGGLIDASRGIIASPNYPGKYPDNATCTWTIQAPSDDYVIRLELLAVALERARHCIYDRLDVFDGLKTDSYTPPMIGRYCSGAPDVIMSSSNSLTLQFVSDESSTYPGFAAYYVMIQK